MIIKFSVQCCTLKFPTAKFYLFIVSRFLYHVTISFTLLRTWDTFVIEVVTNEGVVRSTIGYLSSSWTSFFTQQQEQLHHETVS